MATVTITNILTKVIADGKEAFAPISPTCVPVPCTPVQEYISDMVTLTDGTLLVSAFKKFQKLSIPFGAKTTFEVTDPDEINYWENIKLVGAKVEVADGLIELVEPYTYNAVTFSGTGTQEDPYVPAFAANTFYKVEGDDYVVVDSEPDDWGTAEDKYFTRTENVLPTNDVKGE
jgi:hypothetical protein